MFMYGNWQSHATPDAYNSLCGQFSVERMRAERFDVYGPAGKIIDWFAALADAKILANDLSEKSAVTQIKPRRYQ